MLRDVALNLLVSPPWLERFKANVSRTSLQSLTKGQSFYAYLCRPVVKLPGSYMKRKAGVSLESLFVRSVNSSMILSIYRDSLETNHNH